MALIAVAVHDTKDNGRTKFTKDTAWSLYSTVNWNKHRLFIIDNGSCGETKAFLKSFKEQIKYYTYPGLDIHIITCSQNFGTAEAINLAWKERQPGEFCIKMDNDVIIHSTTWIEEMQESIERYPKIGIVGLKRKDLMESPTQTDIHFRSQLIMLPHEDGQRWMVVEKAKHIMGTCQMYNPDLLDKIGYLCQPSLYGFDDSFASFRSEKAGYINVFLPHIEIEHIDPGGTPYTQWKRDHASEHWQEYDQTIKDYDNGNKSIYYNPF